MTDFADLTDADLKDFIKDRTGRKPHPQSSRDVLLAKARAIPLQQPHEPPMTDAAAAPIAEEGVGDLGKFDSPDAVPANPDAAANIASLAASAPVDDAARQAAIKAAKGQAKAAASQPEPSRLEKVGRNAERTAAQRMEKLREARNKANGVSAEDPMVTVRVLKKGDGRISTGEHAPGLGDLCYDHKETFSCPLSRARELEARDFVEIED